MRIRLLIAVVAVAVLGVIATPGLAQAKPKGTTEEECIKKLEAGGVIDDCQKAPSPILPETNEIVWGGLAFVVLLLVMWKYALPPVRNMMKQREDRIRDDLERAARDPAQKHATPTDDVDPSDRVTPHLKEARPVAEIGLG